MIDEDLNVGNLLETHAKRAPTTQISKSAPLGYAQKFRLSLPTTALAISAVIAVLAIVALSGNTGRRVHVMERY